MSTTLPIHLTNQQDRQREFSDPQFQELTEAVCAHRRTLVREMLELVDEKNLPVFRDFLDRLVALEEASEILDGVQQGLLDQRAQSGQPTHDRQVDHNNR